MLSPNIPSTIFPTYPSQSSLNLLYTQNRITHGLFDEITSSFIIPVSLYGIDVGFHNTQTLLKYFY